MEIPDNPTLVFQYKNKELDRFLRYFPIFGAAILGMIPIILWSSIPSGTFSQINWSEIWQKTTMAPAKLLSVFFHFTIVIVVYWMTSIHAKNARIALDANSLSYSFGVPILSRWLDWRLDFVDLHSSKTSFQLIKYQRLVLPNIKDYHLTLGRYGLRRIHPYSWVFPGQMAVQIQKRSKLVFDLLQGKRPEDKILLQNEFNQLPLVNALINFGINLPKLESAGRHQVGQDLMSHPRMKVVVIGFFVTLAVAFALFHLMRHQHYFSTPHISYQLLGGALAGVFMYAWLWGEKPNTGNTAEQAGFRGTQVLLACLFAVSAGLCVPSLPLLLTSIVQSSQDQTFSIQKSPLMLKASLPANMPDIQPTQASEYWQSLKEGEAVTLPISRGLAGLWWQYDIRVLQNKVELFYDSLPRQTKQ
jgi:hypothetical protein